MPLSITYNLAATSCPLPMTPPSLLDPDAASPSPTTMNSFLNGDRVGVAAKLQRNAVAADVLGRYGGGAYAVLNGLVLSEGAGLTLNISAGQIMCDGPITKAASFTAPMTDASTNYVWLLRTGSPSIRSDTTQPASPGVFLGRVTTAAGAITAIDCSGRLELNQGNLAIRRTADNGCPADSPTAGLRFFTTCLGGLFLWNGSNHDNLTNAGRSAMTFGSDANKTLTAAEYSASFLEFGAGGTALTATRDVILPLTPQGRWWDVKNSSNGGQSLRFIGASGTGITVATGKVARVLADGTNVIRLTADL